MQSNAVATTTIMQPTFLAFVVLVSSLIPSFAQEKKSSLSPTSGKIIETNQGPDAVQVTLFFGGGVKNNAVRKEFEKMGVTPYETNQIVSMKELREFAVNALRREGRQIDNEYICSANIDMSTGMSTLFFVKTISSPHFFVNFNATGQITLVAGSTGFHGEDFWKREYINGHPIGPTEASKPPRQETNRKPPTPVLPRPRQAVGSKPSREDVRGWMSSLFTVRGKDYRLSLSGSKVTPSPPWTTQGSDNPKLLPGRALFLARSVLSKEFTDAKAWSLDSVNIHKYPYLNPETATVFSADRWYYEVTFLPPESEPPGGDGFRVWVLMDGTVVEPEPT